MNRYNTNTFTTVAEAAGALAQPFIAGQPNEYSYNVLAPVIMQNPFG